MKLIFCEKWMAICKLRKRFRLQIKSLQFEFIMGYLRFKILVLFLFGTSLFGQVKNIGLPEIRNYKRTDYKGGTQNWNIDQDKNGNLYFANNNGLFQFDGSTWQKYPLPNSPDVRCVKIDPLGKIFVGGYSEFGYYKTNSKGKLEYVSISKLVNKQKIIDFIWKIHLYKNEVVFQSFARIYSYKNNQLKIVDAPDRFQFSFQIKDHLYLQDISSGLLEYKNILKNFIFLFKHLYSEICKKITNLFKFLYYFLYFLLNSLNDIFRFLKYLNESRSSN